MVRFNGYKITFEKPSPNGEKHYVDLTVYLHQSEVNTIELIYESNEDLFDLALIKKWFDDNAVVGTKCELLMKFCPYGQTDRKMGSSMFTFKYFAHFINSLNFDLVTIYDPHSPVMEGVLNKTFVFYPMAGVKRDRYDLFFYPDNGAAKKYSEIYINTPYRFGNKKRNLETGEIIKYEIIADEEDIKGKTILVRDDLVAGGRTFIEAAKALHEMGAEEIDLYVTHLMPQSKDFVTNYKEYGYNKIYSENTLNLDFYSYWLT